ncbi:MAG: hypothetical protein U9Q98_09405 [Bacteroidota bacterium]|nr:hypothetical protein [Bacteroidota bacterium]
MTKSHWNKRFDTEANDYFKHKIQQLTPGYLLELGAGEDRNAVFAASQGWDVVAVDQSKVAQRKSMAMAKKKGRNCNITVYPDMCSISGFAGKRLRCCRYHFSPFAAGRKKNISSTGL